MESREKKACVPTHGSQSPPCPMKHQDVPTCDLLRTWAGQRWSALMQRIPRASCLGQPVPHMAKEGHIDKLRNAAVHRGQWIASVKKKQCRNFGCYRRPFSSHARPHPRARRHGCAGLSMPTTVPCPCAPGGVCCSVCTVATSGPFGALGVGSECSACVACAVIAVFHRSDIYIYSSLQSQQNLGGAN